MCSGILLLLCVAGVSRPPSVCLLHPARLGGPLLRAVADEDALPADAEPARDRSIYIGGVPFGMDEAAVARLFDGVALPHEVSPVISVTLATDRAGVPRGYGFVELSTVAQAQRARILLHGRSCGFGGRMPTSLTVGMARGDIDTARLLKPIAGRLLWLGNVSFASRPTTVRDAFAAAAGLSPTSVWCSLSRDARTGLKTGFGTVRFPDVASAAIALEAMHGAVLDGRELQVRLDRRAGPAPSARSATTERPPAPVDAIEPELLAALESEQAGAEASAREGRRKQEIERHRRYLSAVAERGGPSRIKPQPRRDRRGRGRPRRPPSAVSHEGPRERCCLVYNLPYALGRAELKRRLLEMIRRDAAVSVGRFSERFQLGVQAAGGSSGLLGPPADELEPEAQEEPVVRIDGDRWGRSRGFGTVQARSRAEARRVAAALDGAVLGGRSLRARLDESPAPAGLPQFRPLWLNQVADDDELTSPTEMTDVAAPSASAFGIFSEPPETQCDDGKAW